MNNELLHEANEIFSPLIGENHCSETNMELFSLFSDSYKDRHGIRPRFFVTEETVKEYFARWEVQAMEREKERALQASIAAGTHPAFTTPETALTFSPFADL